MHLTAFKVVLWYDMSGPSPIGAKSNLLKDRRCEFNGAELYANAQRLQTNERFYRTSIGGDPSGRNSRDRAYRGMRKMPSVTNVTPERVVTGEASATTGTQFPTGGEPVAVAMTSSGGNLYTANLLDGTISAFTVQSTGSLAPVNGSPFQTGLHPIALCVTSNGRFLYVASSGGQNVSGFAISDGGTLTQAGSPSPAGFSPLSVSADTTGNFLYVTSGGSTTAFQRFASTSPLER